MLTLPTRLAKIEDAYERCRVFGCRQPTTAHARKGLHRLYCRRHVDHYRRHGSYFRASYQVSELTSYRRAAYDWLDSRRDAPAVALAISAIQRLYCSAGHHIEAFRLTGRKPDERARAAWARLREAGVDPLRPLAAWLALEMKLLDDPQADRSVEYKRVQGQKPSSIASRAERTSGGSKRGATDASSSLSCTSTRRVVASFCGISGKQSRVPLRRSSKRILN